MNTVEVTTINVVTVNFKYHELIIFSNFVSFQNNPIKTKADQIKTPILLK